MKSLGTIILVVFANILFIYPLSAQNELDKGYSPPKNSILGSEQAGQGSSGDYSEINNNNVRLNIANLIRSNLIFTYERSISNTFSFIGGIGMPIGSDNVQIASLGIMYDADILSNDYNEPINYSSIIANTKVKGGIIGSLAIRAYADTYAEGFYYYEMGIKKVTRNLMWKAPNDKLTIDFQDFYTVDETIKTSVTSLFFNTGRQWNAGKGKYKFNHEISLGIGFRYMQYYKYALVSPVKDVTSDNYDQNVYTLNQTNEKINTIKPYFSMTYSVGIGW